MQLIKFLRSSLLLIAGTSSIGAFAAPPNTGSKTLAPLVQEYSYKVEEAEGATVLDSDYPFTLTVSHHGTERLITSLKLELPAETARYYKSAECMGTNFTIGDGDRKEIACKLLADSQTSKWYRALARAKAYPVLVTPLLSSGVLPTEVLKSPTVRLRVNAGLEPICLGGFFGALIFVLFRMASTYLASANGRQCGTDGAAVWTGLWNRAPAHLACVSIGVVEAILFALRGLLVALIFILLAQALGASNLPLTVKVEDFYGGLIVGLFSVPLSTWLASKLQLPLGKSSDKPADKPGESGDGKGGKPAETEPKLGTI